MKLVDLKKPQEEKKNKKKGREKINTSPWTRVLKCDLLDPSPCGRENIISVLVAGKRRFASNP